MPSTELSDNVAHRAALARSLLAEEYASAFSRASGELVSTPGCAAELAEPGDLLLTLLDTQKRMGVSVVLRMLLDVISSADEAGVPEASVLIEELAASLSEWQVELLRERGAL